MDETKQDRFVCPGDELGTEEEFMPGTGTQVVDGKIVALEFGRLVVDASHKVSVQPATGIPVSISRGMVVYGRVEEIFEPVALVSVSPSKSPGKRQVPLEGYAVLHASRIRNDFVKNVSDEVKRGDLIKAKVEDFRKGDVLLSTVAPEFGVIKAFCEVCRAPLPLHDRMLKCSRCGTIGKRKLSNEYGTRS